MRSQAKRFAQSTIEYALLISIVAAAMIAMQVYLQRAARASLKMVEDQINSEPVEVNNAD